MTVSKLLLTATRMLAMKLISDAPAITLDPTRFTRKIYESSEYAS
jgi:hypothetical protein